MTARIPRTYTLPPATLTPDEKRRLIRAYFAEGRIPKRPIPPNEPKLSRSYQLRRVTRILRWATAALALLIILTGGSVGLAFLILIPGIISFFTFRYVNAHILAVEWQYQNDGARYANDLYEYRERLRQWQILDKDMDNIPSGNQITRWLREDLKKISDEIGMEKLSLIPEQLAMAAEPPKMIYGPILENRKNELDVLDIPPFEFEAAKFDETDQKYRFPCYQFMVIYLDADRISAYAAKFNFLHFTFTASRTFEYLYRNIVSISTEEISIDYRLPQIFSFTNSDGNVEFTLNMLLGSPSPIYRIGKVTLFRLAVPSGDSASVIVDMDFPDKKLLDSSIRTDFESQMRFIRSRLLNIR